MSVYMISSQSTIVIHSLLYCIQDWQMVRFARVGLVILLVVIASNNNNVVGAQSVDPAAVNPANVSIQPSDAQITTATVLAPAPGPSFPPPPLPEIVTPEQLKEARDFIASVYNSTSLPLCDPGKILVRSFPSRS